jgi:membrane protease YdiL (CAAX protease family)
VVATSWRTWAELALAVAILAGDFYGFVPVTSTPFLLALGWISLRRRGLRWRDVGLARPPGFARAIALGVVAGVAMELFATWVTVPALAALTGQPPDLSDFRPLVGNLKLFFLLFAANWVLAAFGEEMAFRGYLMNRWTAACGRTQPAWALSLLVVSALFGWGHGGQGITGMLQEGLAGLWLGLLYLASRRNLAVPIVAHGVSNTVAFVLIYLGRYPGV